MKIKVINPEQFATWGNAIGIVLYSREQDLFVNFFTGDMEHSRVKRKEIGSPSLPYAIPLHRRTNTSIMWIIPWL